MRRRPILGVALVASVLLIGATVQRSGAESADPPAGSADQPTDQAGDQETADSGEEPAEEAAAGSSPTDAGSDAAAGEPSPTDAEDTAADDAASTQLPEAEPQAQVLRLWIPGGFTPDLLDEAAALPGVLSVSVSRSDTVGLIGSRDAAGQVVDTVADGFRIPVSVSAIDPSFTADLMEPGDAARDAVAGLSPGQVILTESAERLRGVGVGGEIDLVGVTGLTVVAIVPDGTLRRAELAVHEDHAEALGLPAFGSVTVAHDAAPGSATDALVEALADLAPEGTPARISQPDTHGVRASPLVLSLPELKTTFGEFAYRTRPGVREIDIERAFVTENIVSTQVPLLGTVTCHEAIIDDLRAALDEVVQAGLGSWVNPRQYGGCFYARHIRVGRDRLSSHSWGAAIDINVDLSMPGLGPVPPDEIIEIFGRNGFRWGGDFTTPDNHHWEWVGDGASERRER